MTSAKIRRRVGCRDSGVGRATGQLSPAQTDSRLVMSVALTAATAPAFPFRAPTQQPQSCLACAALVTGPGSVRLCPSLIWLFSATRVSSPSEHVISSSYRTPLSGYIYTNTRERSGNQPRTIVRSIYNKRLHCFYTGLVVAATTAKGDSRRGGGTKAACAKDDDGDRWEWQDVERRWTTVRF